MIVNLRPVCKQLSVLKLRLKSVSREIKGLSRETSVFILCILQSTPNIVQPYLRYNTPKIQDFIIEKGVVFLPLQNLSFFSYRAVIALRSKGFPVSKVFFSALSRRLAFFSKNLHCVLLTRVLVMMRSLIVSLKRAMSVYLERIVTLCQSVIAYIDSKIEANQTCKLTKRCLTRLLRFSRLFATKTAFNLAISFSIPLSKTFRVTLC